MTARAPRTISVETRALRLATRLGLRVVEVEVGADYARLVDAAGRAVVTQTDEAAEADALVAKIEARVASRRAARRA
jgi:hypothetical protein